MNQFLGKYVVSPFDGKEYCRKNGQFLEHIRNHGYDYQSLFEKFNPDNISYCACGQKCVFDIRKMTYKQTCGSKECANAISRTKRANRTEEQWDDWKQKYKEAIASKTPEEVAEYIQRRVVTGKENGSFKASVAKREATCNERYGDSKYNNSSQISATKLKWDESRKQLFKDRLATALEGRSLNDFHTEEMYVARRKMLEERGDIIPLDQLSEWKKYEIRVRNLTERVYRANRHLINPNNLPRGSAERGNKGARVYQLDHIVPVSYGFKHDIPIELIASVENLQILFWRDNTSKGKKYDPTTSTKHKELEN